MTQTEHLFSSQYVSSSLTQIPLFGYSHSPLSVMCLLVFSLCIGVGPVASSIDDVENTKAIPVYAIGAIVGGLVVVAVAVIVSVILGMVCQKRRRTARTIYITPGKNDFKKTSMNVGPVHDQSGEMSSHVTCMLHILCVCLW